ncbi:unnamed protein product [Rotaria sp. Silwood2]|nr:unnamed protein product [Rotaria sp. Silwood2]CAF2561564.1 unnamed protein product [Rotaria sp. Silwood2]CAF2751713.1 unnamed protein product [Rotaria sp. Silwood2]CAF3854404.1 unnamed protein product [Rotaria sp. Silwood2]CAF3876479.1 unnamed protein product [Rotaria sp. Silwood2]
MFIACNVKYLGIGKFSSLKFDTIKSKLFENENEYHNENVPPINVHLDFPKSELSPSLPPPFINLHVPRSLINNC